MTPWLDMRPADFDAATPLTLFPPPPPPVKADPCGTPDMFTED